MEREQKALELRSIVVVYLLVARCRKARSNACPYAAEGCSLSVLTRHPVLQYLYSLLPLRARLLPMHIDIPMALKTLDTLLQSAAGVGLGYILARVRVVMLGKNNQLLDQFPP